MKALRLLPAALLLFGTALAALVTAKADNTEIPLSPTRLVTGCPHSGWPLGSLEQCFYKSALAFRYPPPPHSTKWRGTQCPGQSNAYWGHCACAAAASVVIMNATHDNLGFINVDSFTALAKSGKLGGGFVADGAAKPGDVILWYSWDYTEAHIGFCATAGCTQTWSNSSQLGRFAPVAHSISLDGYYPRHMIWEPRHLP